VAPRVRSIERPLLINGYAYLAVSLLDNGQVDSNSYATEITDRCLGKRSGEQLNALSQQQNS
jgi:hypothetical protein